MRLFNHEVFTGSGMYSGIELDELEKRFIQARACMGGLQQAGCGPEPLGQDIVDREEQELEDAVRDLVCGLTNREITFIGPRKPWGESRNLETWVPLMVDHRDKSIQATHACCGPSYNGTHYLVPVPKEMMNDEKLRAELLADKPKGFNPSAHKYDRDYIKHLQACYENQICIQCGRKEGFDGESYPHCSIHTPYLNPHYGYDQADEPTIMDKQN